MGISVWIPGWRTGKNFPFRYRYGNVEEAFLPVFKGLFEDAGIPLVFHAAKHDKQALLDFGIDIGQNYYCTMLMTHFINEELPSKSLDSVSRFYGGNPKNRSKVMQKLIDRFGWGMLPVELVNPYAANDAQITGELFQKLLPTFRKEGFDGELWDREKRFSDIITEMEILGVRIDRELSEREASFGEQRLDEIRNRLGLNPASSKDMEELFINRLGLDVEKTSAKTGAPSFDKEVMEIYDAILERRDDSTARLVFEFRGWHKTVTSNYRPYLELSYEGILHPGYKLHGTRTGRLSCERPNLQQIPRESAKRWNGNLKKAFLERDGYTQWEYDYSNLEMRIAACYGNDSRLLETFNSGRKLFRDMAAQLRRDYDSVKTLNYAISYGAGIKRISKVFGVSEDEARALRNGYFRNYGGLYAASKNASSVAARRGYVKMWTGRRRHFEPGTGGHKPFNSVCQGGGAEIVKTKILELKKELDPTEVNLVLTVHDSVVAQIEAGKEEKWDPIIRRVMEDVGSLNDGFKKCPFPVEGKRWGA